MRKTTALAFILLLAACSSGRPTGAPVVVGAVYPLTGPQGGGGTAEAHGVRVAAEMVNESGGIAGRPLRIRWMDAPGPDAAPGAIEALDHDGIKLVIGSHGSTISRPVAAEAARRGMLFWETGAVGEMTGEGAGQLVFRVAPTGAVLGRAAVSFIADRLSPLLKRRPSSLRFAVANVDDVYGSAVARGAVDEIRDRRLLFAGQVSYNERSYKAADIVRRIAALRPDVLFVSAYIDDGVALRAESVRRHLRLVASIGTSSSYCMPEFGARLGAVATGLFASDKPDSDLNPAGLDPGVRKLLAEADARYRKEFGAPMDAPALAGFAAAWALFNEVMKHAKTLDPASVAGAARSVTIPQGGLPNGSGLQFGAPGTPDAGANLRAASVIWEWAPGGKREVVWPPQYATAPIKALAIA